MAVFSADKQPALAWWCSFGAALSLATSLPGHLMTPLHDIASQQSTVQEGSRLSVHYGIIGVQVTAMLVMLPNLP